MARGGYRPGAGRKKGSKDKKKRKQRADHAEVKKIKEVLSNSMIAKAKLYNDYLKRVQRGEKIPINETKLMNTIANELKEYVSNEVEKGEEKTPLEYMLEVMNDNNEDPDRRDKMAIAAAPYFHDRQGKGKKEEMKYKAKTAGKGRFSAGKSPLRAVK